MKRINHQEAYSFDGACTNQTEEYFSRLRRAEIGIHHHIAGAYLLRYAQESSWRKIPPRLEWRSGDARSFAGDEARQERGLHLLLAAAYCQLKCRGIAGRTMLGCQGLRRGRLAGGVIRGLTTSSTPSTDRSFKIPPSFGSLSRLNLL
jgi:hypothetical protein